MTKQLLKQNIYLRDLEGDSCHQSRCANSLLIQALTFNFDTLPLEDNIPIETKMSSTHVEGYVNRNDEQNELESF